MNINRKNNVVILVFIYKIIFKSKCVSSRGTKLNKNLHNVYKYTNFASLKSIKS